MKTKVHAALTLLGLNETQANIFFEYMKIAGYFEPKLLQKAFDYLALSKPLDVTKDQFVRDIIEKNGDAAYMDVGDCIELLVFLQQTAFDREYGVERDKLQAKPWMEEHQATFCNAAKILGVTEESQPQHKTYIGAAIMGAASMRAQSRIAYAIKLNLPQNCKIWALSGNRELSKGLDSDEVMEKVAVAVGKPVNFVEKGEGAARRTYLNGVTETMMVNALLQEMCPGKNIAVVDSAIEGNHWRATAKQSAEDIVKIIVSKILEEQNEGIQEPAQENHFMIIAENPHTSRMAEQVQQAFFKFISEQKLQDIVNIKVEGVGAGVSTEQLANVSFLPQINSALASLMAVRYDGIRLARPALCKRDPRLILFSQRDQTYKDQVDAASKEHDASLLIAAPGA